MTPRIGQIVLYNHPVSTDETYPKRQSTAIVQHVADNDTCFLWVFGHYDVKATRGDGPNQWNWLPNA